MNHRKWCHIPFGLLLVAAVAVFTPVPELARARVSCETYEPCTMGTCLLDGSCEAEPVDNGIPCATFDPCTAGTCTNGECVQRAANNGAACETFNACMLENGECSDGECIGSPLSNGSACRENVLGPCFTGTCTSFEGTAFCIPEFKCGLPSNPCVFNCNPANGNCEPFPLNLCEGACTTATCMPAGGGFDYTCTNVQNRADNTACNDGNTCNGNQDKCEAGDCVGTSSGGAVCGDGAVNAPEQCDDGDDEFAFGEYCDEACELVPCGKPTNSSGTLPKASDALFTLKAAVQSASCHVLVCDVNDSGTITASDALMILKKAVGTAVTLNCPAS